MRGSDDRQETLFSTVIPEQRVPSDHPLRPIRRMVDEALKELDVEFNALYADGGRASIAPEKLLRAQLLMVLYTIRSERQLVVQINYNLLFRWFVGFSMDDEVWHHSTFTRNRDRLLEGEVAHKFFARVLDQALAAGLLSKEHFSVDGTLIEALPSLKSYRPRDEKEPPTKGQGDGGQAQLHGAFADGEPERTGGGRTSESGHRHSRARCGDGDGQGARKQASRDGGCGQELRYERFHQGDAQGQCYAACGAECQQPFLGD